MGVGASRGSSGAAGVADVMAMVLDQDGTYRFAEFSGLTPGVKPGVKPADRLVMFSDDWGRHPSSCQHLARHLLADHDVLWVNTVGTRRPSLTRADFRRAVGKVGGWLGRGDAAGGALPAGLQVISPKMWPGFRRPWQRRLNANAITWQVHEALGHRSDQQRIAVTTLPITADLVGRLDVDRWVYYCVDDFSVWPGLDSDVMQAMERELVGKVDEVVAVSETLRDRIAGMGRESVLLTHGIDLEHWQGAGARSAKPQAAEGTGRPVVLFWGLIDQRLDTAWCKALAQALQRHGGTFILAGPQQSPDPVLAQLPNTRFPGSVAYDDLPELAAGADVLVMPYIDAPVTRAMQPLKFKEYLATGKPVVARDLPATSAWRDAADLTGDAQAFVELVLARATGGVTPGQTHARKRLAGESWSRKAKQFASVWDRQPIAEMRAAA